MITKQKFHLYSLKVSAHVKIPVEYFENFGGGANSPPWLRAWWSLTSCQPAMLNLHRSKLLLITFANLI